MPGQANQPHRECLYAWYPEAIDPSAYATVMDPREIYLRNGLDADLLDQRPPINRLTSAYNSSSSSTSSEVVERYKQSIAPSDFAYHSAETIDEALNPPWALHYQLKRGPATPNPPSNATDMLTREEPPRRLKSAPVVRSFPSTAILTIPEPRFVTAFVPVTTTSSTPPRTRASSAKARLSSSVSHATTPKHGEIRSAHVSRRKSGETNLSDEEIQQIFRRIYGTPVARTPQAQPVQIIYTEPQSAPAPVYVYQKSATWCPEEVPVTPPVRRSVEVSAIPLNPHYLHRPGVIAVRNVEKKPVVRTASASRKPTRHHSLDRRNQPLLAVTPIPQKVRLSLEIGGVKLTYDPKLSLNDKSANLTKYFIDGRLYLIKEQRYNVLDNIDPSSLAKSNQTSTLRQRPKYYQTIPVEQFRIPSATPDVHYNAPETYFYETAPKRPPRYVIDPNFISENLNVSRTPFAKRRPTATVHA